MARPRRTLWLALLALLALASLAYALLSPQPRPGPDTLPFDYPRQTSLDAGTAEPADPVNLIVFATDERQLVDALKRAGWKRVGTFSEERKRIISDLENRTTPISPRYLFGREQDLAFQGANATIEERDHVRFWRLNATVFLGAASRDDGISPALNDLTPTITHVIAPDIDAEREKVGGLLGGAARFYTGGTAPTAWRGAGGAGWYCTDGRILVVALDGGGAPQPPPESQAPPQAGCSRLLLGVVGLFRG